MNDTPAEGIVSHYFGKGPSLVDVNVEVVLRICLRCFILAMRTGETGGHIEFEDSLDCWYNRSVPLQYCRQ